MMNPEHTMHAAQYFTATIHEWRNVLSEDNHKDIIIDNPQFMVNDMKYTAQQLKRSLIKNKSAMLDTFKVDKYDREYQIWKREPLSIELLNESMFKQKLEYIRYNPVRAGLCNVPEDYYYSSAKFYFDGTNSFGMLKHYFRKLIAN